MTHEDKWAMYEIAGERKIGMISWCDAWECWTDGSKEFVDEHVGYAPIPVKLLYWVPDSQRKFMAEKSVVYNLSAA